ncbi:MAG: SRPBCC family protein [Deltaproteobacteria bacterium]
MANGFTVKEKIDRPSDEVWSFLTDMSQAGKWMTGVEKIKPVTPGPIGLGSRFSFVSRGAERETEVSTWEPQKVIALTSTQGGITATYEYSVSSHNNYTEVRLNAVCKAKGFWKIIHPLILFLMKKSDSNHLARLKNAIENSGS